MLEDTLLIDKKNLVELDEYKTDVIKLIRLGVRGDLKLAVMNTQNSTFQFLSPGQLQKIYSALTVSEKKRIGFCIDTCHVFATGILPYDYLSYFTTNYPGAVALIHLNDSKKEKGSRVDRHAIIGEGYIGMAEIEEVAGLAVKNGIPMVMEPSG